VLERSGELSDWLDIGSEIRLLGLDVDSEDLFHETNVRISRDRRLAGGRRLLVGSRLYVLAKETAGRWCPWVAVTVMRLRRDLAGRLLAATLCRTLGLPLR